MPPKIDMSTSEVYRLIHETEDPIKKKNEEQVLKEKNYCEPVSYNYTITMTIKSNIKKPFLERIITLKNTILENKS